MQSNIAEGDLQANMFGTTNRHDRSLSDLCNRLAPLPSKVYATPAATATQQSLVMLKSGRSTASKCPQERGASA
eukprot:13045155-Alexandrium_andersonii.AAC.1